MSHIITVSIDPDGSVRAVPNPLPDRGPDPPPPRTAVSPRDTVTWNFGPTVGGRELQVVFQEVQDLSTAAKAPCNPLGPLSNLTLGFRWIDGTVRPDVSQDLSQAKRFIYRIIENGTPLPWANPVGGQPSGALDGGGIDIPRTPP